MQCAPPPITFIPCEEHFRPVLPTIQGNVDYLALRGQLTTIDELLSTSGVENEFVLRSLNHWIKTLSESKVDQIELSGEGPLAKKATALITELLGWMEDQFRAIG